MIPIKESYYPNAYLVTVRNVKSGLTARTRILAVLEQRSADAANLAIDTSLSYEAVFHHLRLLELEGTVKRRGKRPYSWTLTGLGQTRLS